MSSPSPSLTAPASPPEETATLRQVPKSSEAVRRGEVKARFLPLDAYRGLIMILLVSDGFGFAQLPNHGFYHFIANQFEHKPWGGAVFYDLIMPAFLFMVGVAMPFALGRRAEQGATPRDNFRHVLVRCLRLIVISEIIVSIGENRAHLSVHNVLTVVAITYFICFFLMRLDLWKQAVAAAMLLAFHSAIYLLFPGPAAPLPRSPTQGHGSTAG